MSKTPRHRPLRQQEFTQAVAALRVRHSWLAGHVIEPAPGHLSVVSHLFEQFERLLRPSDLKRLRMLCVSAPRERLTVHYELSRCSESRRKALLDVTIESRESSLQLCPVCGAPVSNPSAYAKRCPGHQGLQGLFAEEVRRSRQMLIDQGVQQTIRDLGRFRPEDLRAITADEEGASPAEESSTTETMPATAIEQPQIPFLDPAGLKVFLDRHRPKGDDKLKRAQVIVDRIVQAGGERRKLGLLPADWGVLLDEFEHAFPNFRELAELLRDHFALASLGDRRISWPAVLLVGPAGIGKTEAARWLSERLSLPCRVFDMASAQSGSPLAGSEAFWSNSEPGQLFELLAYQPLANPIVVLDELDKVEGERNQHNPLAALYTLLEARSAQAFTDLSVRDFSIDASHVNWVATANSLESILGPIRSRLTVLQIAPPTPEQIGTIAQSIYVRLRNGASWGHAFAERLDGNVITLLRPLPPRALGMTIRRAVGAAARAGRGHVQVGDVTLTVESSKRKIGFTAS